MKFHSMNQRDSKKTILPVPIGYQNINILILSSHKIYIYVYSILEKRKCLKK